MKQKPRHLGPEYATQFCDGSVASAYSARPPYPAETFEIMLELLPDVEDPAVLDLGCGHGDLTLPLAYQVSHVDGVDFSAAMLAHAQSRAGGNLPAIHWHCIPAEEFTSDRSYALICAGQSLHWMDWGRLFPQIKRMLHPDAFLVLAERQVLHQPWSAEIFELIPSYSTNTDYQPYNLVDELTTRGLFIEHGRKTTQKVPFEQDLDHYVESFHSSNGFSRERMDLEAAQEFDQRVREIVTRYCPNEKLECEVVAAVIWGRP